MLNAAGFICDSYGDEDADCRILSLVVECLTLACLGGWPEASVVSTQISTIHDLYCTFETSESPSAVSTSDIHDWIGEPMTRPHNPVWTTIQYMDLLP